MAGHRSLQLFPAGCCSAYRHCRDGCAADVGHSDHNDGGLRVKRIILPAILVFFCVSPLLLSAQNSESHFELGAFADYFRIDRTTPDLNYVGVGGRIGFNLRPSIQIEAEMAYDFDRNYTNTYSNGINTTFVSSKTHILNGLIGPKFQTGSGPVRLFVTGKVGAVDFNTTSATGTSGFNSALGAFGNGNTKFAVYPAGGIEAFAGPIGLRLEVGDEIYFDSGAQNNLRVTFGPTLRF
jgi:hypothetical protein